MPFRQGQLFWSLPYWQRQGVLQPRQDQRQKTITQAATVELNPFQISDPEAAPPGLPVKNQNEPRRYVLMPANQGQTLAYLLHAAVT